METNPQESKKTWVTPQLIVHGDVDQITNGCNKTMGPSDGFTFMGDPIHCTGGS